MNKITISESRKICELLAARVGIIISEDRIEMVSEVVSETMKRAGITNFLECCQFISFASFSEPRMQAIIDQITIGETFFFRDSAQFKALREAILPELIQQSRATHQKVNILSAGCSTGEEPFSVAMLAHEMLSESEQWRIELIGGDINLTALSKANMARYGKWSFRGVDPLICQRYFEPAENFWQLSEQIRKKVRFQYLNLAEELPFSNLDLILMRNVTIYFSAQFKEQLAERCARALREGGLLLVGAGEISQHYYKQFEEVTFAGVSLFRKRNPRAGGKFPTGSYKLTDKLNEKVNDKSSERFPTGSYKTSDKSSERFPTGSYKTSDGDRPGDKAGEIDRYKRTEIAPEPERNTAKRLEIARLALESKNAATTPPPRSSTGSFQQVKEPQLKAAQSQANETAASDDSYRAAERDFNNKRLNEAAEKLTKIIDSDERALLLLARIEANRGNYRESEQHCRRYLKKQPDGLAAHFLLGLIYQTESRYHQAAEELRYATFLDRNFVMGHWHLALVYQQLGDRAAMQRHLLRARTLLNSLSPEVEVEFSEGEKAARILQTVEMMLKE